MPVEAMAHRMKTPEGKKLYGLRKQTPEPVFGIIKSVLGFRQFRLRGIDAAGGCGPIGWFKRRPYKLGDQVGALPELAVATDLAGDIHLVRRVRRILLHRRPLTRRVPSPDNAPHPRGLVGYADTPPNPIGPVAFPSPMA